MSVKPIRDIVLEIYNEILSYSNYLYDRVFLLSHFQVPNQKQFKLYIAWDYSELPDIEEGENIKLIVI
jgi:hypothetical protein